MSRYIIRTKQNKTYLLGIEKETKLLGYIGYNFILRGGKLPLLTEVKTPQRIGGYVETFYPKESCIRVYNSKREEVAYLEKSGRLRIDGVYLPCKRLSKNETIVEEEKEKRKKLRDKLERLGLTHSYLLNDSEVKGKIYCFRKGSDISTLLSVSTKTPSGIEELLRFIPLAISKRIFEQEFIRKFIGN